MARWSHLMHQRKHWPDDLRHPMTHPQSWCRMILQQGYYGTWRASLSSYHPHQWCTHGNTITSYIHTQEIYARFTDTIQTLGDVHQLIVDIAKNICSIHTCAEKINGVNLEGIPKYQFTEWQVRRINQTTEALDQGMDEDLANHWFMVFKARD